MVDIDNRNASSRMIPIYQRDAMKAKTARVHTVKRFVAEHILPLSVD